MTETNNEISDPQSHPSASGESTQARFPRAWLVAGVTLGALVAAAAFRSSIGLLLEPIEQEFGWSRATTSGAITLNLVIYGLVAPFAAAFMERWGIRRVVVAALGVISVSSGLTTLITHPWQLWVLWGLFIGTATGTMALVFGAIVANRWFARGRGLVMGIFSAANATGQLIFLPIFAIAVERTGWRSVTVIVAVLALLMMVLVRLFLDDSPADRGLTPYGSAPGTPVTQPPHGSDNAARTALVILAQASQQWAFWALMLGFFICGWSTNGLIQTHFVPAAHDHAMPTTTAAGLLAVVGIFDIVGTLVSGWLTDRMDSRILLAVYYSLRGLSLLVVHQMLAPTVNPGLWIFIIFYGLDWVATVPPTVALCRRHFGVERSGVVFGWVFASHMVGAGIGASAAGLIREMTGSYQQAWLLAAVLCLGAAVFSLSIPRRPRKQLTTIAS